MSLFIDILPGIIVDFVVVFIASSVMGIALLKVVHFIDVSKRKKILNQIKNATEMLNSDTTNIHRTIDIELSSQKGDHHGN